MVDNDKYFGIYRGIVFDSDDPEKLGRIKLKVPQVLGEEIVDWAWPIGGAITQSKFPYITLTKTNSQTVAGANTATIVSFTNTEVASGIELVNSSKITFYEYGEYLLQFSAVFSKATSVGANVDIWFRVNGADLPRSNTRVVTTGNPNEVTVTVLGVATLEPDDYVQIVFSSPDANMKLTSFTGLTNPVRPDVPGIIFGANLIGNWRPKPDTGVWVMFEGGDPNYPLWVGGF